MRGCYCSSALKLHLPFSHTPGTALTAFCEKESLEQAPLERSAVKEIHPLKAKRLLPHPLMSGFAGMVKQER